MTQLKTRPTQRSVTGFLARIRDPGKRHDLMTGFPRHRALMRQLGKHRTGRSCLYIKRLSEIDLPTLRRLVRESVRALRAKEVRT